MPENNLAVPSAQSSPRAALTDNSDVAEHRARLRLAYMEAVSDIQDDASRRWNPANDRFLDIIDQELLRINAVAEGHEKAREFQAEHTYEQGVKGFVNPFKIDPDNGDDQGLPGPVFTPKFDAPNGAQADDQ